MKTHIKGAKIIVSVENGVRTISLTSTTDSRGGCQVLQVFDDAGNLLSTDCISNGCGGECNLHTSQNGSVTTYWCECSSGAEANWPEIPVKELPPQRGGPHALTHTNFSAQGSTYWNGPRTELWGGWSTDKGQACQGIGIQGYIARERIVSADLVLCNAMQYVYRVVNN